MREYKHVKQGAHNRLIDTTEVPLLICNFSF